jgi:hypothetical protein
MGLRDQFPHTLIPLDLAVLIVQQEVYGKEREANGADPNSIAAYIASAVPLYEVGKSAATEPRLVLNLNRQAVFTDGGKEAVFLDGRPSKHLLAVHAKDVPCVIAMLKDPPHAEAIRRKTIVDTSRKLVEQSRTSRARCLKLEEAQDALKKRSQQMIRNHRARFWRNG